MAIENGWFEAPNVTKTEAPEGFEENVPKYSDKVGVEAWVGHTRGGSGGQSDWFVRFYAESSVLDEIASNDDASELSITDVQDRLSGTAYPESGSDAAVRSSFHASLPP